MLKHELNVLIGVAAGVALAGVAIPAGIVLESFYRRTAITEKGMTMARVLAPALAEALERPDDPRSRERLDAIVAGLEHARDAVGAAPLDLEGLAVLDAQGKILKTSGEVEKKDLTRDSLILRARIEVNHDVLVEMPDNRWGKNGEALMAFAAPLRADGEPRGTLWFTLSLERARWFFWQTFLGILAGIGAGAAMVWFVLYKALKFRILQPIVELSQGIEKLRAGDLGARVALARKDEFGTLIASFNDLVAILREKPLIDAKLDEAERLEITNRRLVESHQRLAEAHADLQAAKEALALREKQASFQRFVRSIAHELKNPLHAANAAIAPLAAALARPEKSKEDLDDIESALGILKRSVSRAVSIIHDLQGFAQLGEADLVEVELRHLIEDAALACQPLLGDRVKLELDVKDEEGRPAIALKAFPTLLAQVFVNLFTNAAQAIEGPGTISVTARRKGDRVKIEVKDSGPGIPAEHLNKLFEPFFTTKGVVGTGLGLALSYAYLEKHGGSIEARSEAPTAEGPARGASFAIDLPVSPRPTGELGPKASAIFESPEAALARARRGV